MSEPIDLKFRIIPWTDSEGNETTAIWHCCECQPMTDERVKAAIEFHLNCWRIKHVTTGVHEECAKALSKQWGLDEE